jgi:hypothetical protein
VNELNRHQRRRKDALERRQPRWTLGVGDLPIAPDQVVILDTTTVYILPPAYGSGGEISIEYANGAYIVNRGKREFQIGDQDVTLTVWPDNARSPRIVEPMSANEGEVNTLECHLVGWRLTRTGEIKTRLIPILKDA